MSRALIWSASLCRVRPCAPGCLPLQHRGPGSGPGRDPRLHRKSLNPGCPGPGPAGGPLPVASPLPNTTPRPPGPAPAAVTSEAATGRARPQAPGWGRPCSSPSTWQHPAIPGSSPLAGHPGPRGQQEGDKSEERRLNLSGSWQQGHSTAYNTAFQLSGLQRIYPNERVELSCMAPTPACDRRRRIHRLCSWNGKNPAYS